MTRNRITMPAASICIVRGACESPSNPKAPALNFWAKRRKPREAVSVLGLPAYLVPCTPPGLQHPEKCCL